MARADGPALEICHVRELPALPGRTASWPAWLAPGSIIRSAVEGLGIDALWEHQAVAANELAAGRHLVLTTGTASGKSLAYLLPIAAAELGGSGGFVARPTGEADPTGPTGVEPTGEVGIPSSGATDAPGASTGVATGGTATRASSATREAATRTGIATGKATTRSSSATGASATRTSMTTAEAPIRGSSPAEIDTDRAAGDDGERASAMPIRWRRRPATSLYLAPTKALAHDQARLCAELALPGWRVAVVDGDTDPADRQWARDHAHHVLTNPDLVHASLLPNHERWASFLRALRYVVVDESHRYRGVFGAQVAAVLRRLRRIAARYGSEPTFAVLSATSPDPRATAATLTGIGADDLVCVDTDRSPRGRIRISLARASDLSTEEAAARELAARVRRGEQVITFVSSRRLAEDVARAAAAQMGASGEQILAYRAGYLATDRRRIERGLRAGTVRGVAATNALELGVDIAGLDSVVLCGYPGTRAAFWQQLGRAGRRGGPAEVVMIARPRPLDAYLLDNPAALFDQPVESPVLDPASASVLGPQLAAAAQEQPLRPGDERWFGATTWTLVSRLTERGILRRRPDGWYWTAPRRAVDRINLRTADALSLDIVEEDTGRVLGTVAVAMSDLVVHPGAVYLHQGESFLCRDTDRESREVYVRAARPGYVTQALADLDLHPGPAERERRCGSSSITVGPALVRSTVTGFLRRDEVTGQVWDSMPLDCPERVLSTTAMLVTVPDGATGAIADSRIGPPPESDTGPTGASAAGSSRSRRDAGVHALEHLLGGLLPALVANDRSDVGMHSWVGEDGSAVVAVFDNQASSGFAGRAFERAEDWLAAARNRLESCPCETGCPSCILAAGCASSRPLDKAACRRLLAAVAEAPLAVGSGLARREETGQR